MCVKVQRADWKFATSTILGIIAIAAPLWLWRADLDAKKIDMTLLGSFELISSASKSQQGLRILYDGKDLKNPFSSILAISNAGAKPIQSSDFEGPIKIVVTKPARILRSQVVSHEPQSLEPLISTNERMIAIEPMLLNPGDRISVEILTTGGKPEFASRGRIAGVPDVKIQESQSAARLIITVFGSPVVVNLTLGWLIFLFSCFGFGYAYFTSIIALAKGGNSLLVALLGISSITFTFVLSSDIFGHSVFGFTGIGLLLFKYAAFSAGMLLCLAAIRLFPVRR
jgi:hypothetical protein